MAQYQSADLSQGYEKYYALRNNLEGIMEKVNEMGKYKLDISYYENKLEDIKDRFGLVDKDIKTNSISKSLSLPNLKKDYEGFVLGPLNKELEVLTLEFEENITPIYNVYLLSNYIEKKINKNSGVEEIISKTIELINNINSIPSHNNIDINKLYDKAYEIVIKALLYESVFNKTEILNHIKVINQSSTQEALGKLMRKLIKKQIKNGLITSNDVDEEFIKNINEGLGYDYLSEDFIKLLSKTMLSDNYEALEEERTSKIENAERQVKRYVENYNRLQENLKVDKVDFNISAIKNVLIKGAFCSFVLVPAIGIFGGHALGKSSSEKIIEYATITREYDLETKSIIGEEEKIYDDRETSYVATIVSYEPWQVNPTGGYIRNAYAYDYETPENVSEEYHIENVDLANEATEKYRYSMVRSDKPTEEEMTKKEIHITETYQDKSDWRKSTRYVIPFTIVGSILGIGAEAALILSGLYEELKRINYNLSSSFEDNKKALKNDKENLKEHLENIDSVINEAEEVNKTYSTEIDVTPLKRIKKK